MADKLSDRRMNLDKLLRSIVKERCGEEHVYYQPPTGLKMKYPCICYERSKIRNAAASNKVYIQRLFYQITVIDPRPDSEMTAAVAKLERASHDRLFMSDNLYHDVFTIYY